MSAQDAMEEDQQSTDAAGADDDTIDTARRDLSFLRDFASAVILRPREPFLDWVRHHLPEGRVPSDHEAARPAVAIIPPLPRAEDQESWLREYSDELFSRQLQLWASETEWPEDRSLDVLRTWFDLEMVTGIDDLREFVPRPVVTCGPVSLTQLTGEFVALPDGALFIDVATGDILALSEPEIGALDADDAEELGIGQEDLDTLRKAYESPSLVEVLAHNEFDELEAMVQFAEAQPIVSVRTRLLDALRGRKAFRRFKDAVDAAGLREKWFASRDAAVADLLKNVLDELEIPYEDARAQAPPPD